MASAIFLVGQNIAIGRVGLHVVKRRNGVRRVSECRVGSYVVDFVAADINDTPVTERFEVFFSAAKHGRYLSCVGPYAPPCGSSRVAGRAHRQQSCAASASTPTSTSVLRWFHGETSPAIRRG